MAGDVGRFWEPRDDAVDRADVEFIGTQFDDERHQEVEVARLVAVQRSPFHAIARRGLETMMAIGDDKGFGMNAGGDLSDGVRVVDLPDAVDDPVVVGRLVMVGREPDRRRERLRQTVRERKAPDRRDVHLAGAQQVEAVLAELRHRALMGEHLAAFVVEAERADHAGRRSPGTSLVAEGHPVRVERRAFVADQDPVPLPGVEERRRVLVPVEAARRIIDRQFDQDRVEAAARRKSGTLVRTDDVVRRGDDVIEVDAVRVVAQSAEGLEAGHRRASRLSASIGQGARDTGAKMAR